MISVLGSQLAAVGGDGGGCVNSRSVPFHREWSFHRPAMEVGDVEFAAEYVMAQAGFGGWDVPLPSIIARQLFGPAGWEAVHGLGVHGELKLWEGGGKVRVSASLSPIERDFAGAHELGHFADHRLHFGLEGQMLEDACSMVAAALMMPRDPYLDALRDFGDDWEGLGLLFGVTETAAALRAGELTGRPIAVVAPLTCRVRGEAQWPAEQTLREWKTKPGPGLVAARLRDDPRRVVLVGGGER